MEESVQGTEIEFNELITIRANMPELNDLILILNDFLKNQEINSYEFLYFKCKALEDFNGFIRMFYENYKYFFFFFFIKIYYLFFYKKKKVNLIKIISVIF